MQVHWRFAKNAFANLGRGGASAVVALLLPPVLVRHMAPASYAVWILVLQVAAYLGYLDFGLQTAIGRYVAFANEKGDTEARDGIYSTAFAGLSVAGLLGLVLILLAISLSRTIFPSIPLTLLPSMRLAILIVGTSVALGLPASAWNGIFIGLQRYEIPAVTIGAGRLLSAVGLMASAVTGRSLVFMAFVMAAANVFSYVLQFGLLRRVASEFCFRTELVTRKMITELSGYCFSLTVWQFGTLLVSGFDLILAGRFQFSAVTSYSAAATLILTLGGVQNAIFSTIMPHAAQLQAQQDREALGNLLVSATRFGVLLLLLTGLPLVVFGAPIIGIFIGPQFAHSGATFLAILSIANIFRLTGVPYASILIGTGQQRLVLMSPLMEGVINFVASILLGLRFGAIGVAWGTLIGAVASVLANVFYNLPRTRDSIDCSKLRYVCEAIGLPASCGIPVCLALLATTLFKSIGMAIVPLAWMVSCAACVMVILRAGMKVDRGVLPQSEILP